jgi:hypothetical protein
MQKLVKQVFLSWFIPGVLLWGLIGRVTDAKCGSKTEVNRTRHVVLLGASVGQAWNISALPERLNKGGYTFEYRHGGSQFDKSARLEDILSGPGKKPDAVFLKECAAYFPGDLESYQKLMEGWVRRCQESGVVPIPTTVVPVTRLHPLKKFIIDILKLRNPFKMGNPFQNRRNRSILVYNDWIKGYCQAKGLVCLDLEAAVRYSETNRFLREDLARLDGLHLNRKAYKLLDEIVFPLLDKVNWKSENDGGGF